MFSDTHFHLNHICERGEDGADMIRSLAENGCRFALDIGTESGDLNRRQDRAQRLIAEIEQKSPPLADRARALLFFSAGIWPDFETAKQFQSHIAELSRQIQEAGQEGRAPIALGECGADFYYISEDNKNEAAQAQDDLFSAQIELARSLSLPVIVHSRDAFDLTLSCLKNAAYDRAVIHCFSYGLSQARAFLDLGLYISFSGAITYAKKSRQEELSKLLRFIPKDRLLIETDAPYLAPAPHRGKTNTPLFIRHTYEAAANHLNMDAQALSDLVEANIRTFFSIAI